MRKHLHRPSPAMVVAMIALVAAFAGPAVASDAVDFAKKKLINGKNIKSRSISGSKLKNDTLTGIQISESKLGKVPSATNADTAANATNATKATSATNATNATNASHATNADTVDGFDASDLGETLWAVVDGTATTPTIVRSFGTAGAVADIGTGLYGVTFDQDVSGCVFTATVGDPGAGVATEGYATVEGLSIFTPDGVEVRTFNNAGTLADRSFHLVVTC
jgi:hypothetical protein